MKRARSKITFTGDQPTEVNADPPYEDTFQVSNLDKRRSIDPMSSMLHLIAGVTASAANPCGKSVPIYDGKHRYNLNVKHIEDLKITDKIVSAYEGPGMHCKMQYEEVAGFRAGSDNKRYPFVDTFMASVDNGKYIIPLRLNIGTEYGFAVIRATNLEFESPTAKHKTAQIEALE